MPRLTTEVTTLIEQLARLQAQINQSRRDILGYAREAGDLLLSVPSTERAALAAAAGITGRSTRFDYVQISEHWEAVQRAGSIREALRIIRHRPDEPVDLRDVPLPFEDRCVNDEHVGLPIGQCAMKTWA
jgi:hypothetical protein